MMACSSVAVLGLAVDGQGLAADANVLDENESTQISNRIYLPSCACIPVDEKSSCRIEYSECASS